MLQTVPSLGNPNHGHSLPSSQVSGSSHPEYPYPASAPTPVGMRCPPLEIRRLINAFTPFIALDRDMEKRLLAKFARPDLLSFLNASDPYHAYYQHQLSHQQLLLQSEKQTRSMIEKPKQAQVTPPPSHNAFTAPPPPLSAISRGAPSSPPPPPPGVHFTPLRAPRPFAPMLVPLPLMNMIPPPPFPTDDPHPKWQGVADSSLISEDRFLLQHPGPGRIKISVPNAGEGNLKGQLLRIFVQSFSETIGSLKEKIAGEIQLPVNKQKLRGRAAFLKDNMSLAQHNIGGGETLTLVVAEEDDSFPFNSLKC